MTTVRRDRSEFIFIGSDNPIEYKGAKNTATAAYLNAATVTFTLYDGDPDVAGVAVAGATAVAMAYVAASNGNYLGILESTVVLTENAHYWVQVDFAEGTIGDQRKWEVKAITRPREGWPEKW